MDLTNPIASISSGVEGDVLAVLAGTRGAMTGLSVETGAGRSHAQVRAVLHRLVAEGIVLATRVGNAVQYRLNRDHVLADAVVSAADAHRTVERRVHEFLAATRPGPEAAILFGSFARRDGDSQSDIDLLLVRPDRIADDDEAWCALRAGVAERLELWTGNECQVIDLSMRELRYAARKKAPLVSSLINEGRAVLGESVGAIVGRSSIRTLSGAP